MVTAGRCWDPSTSWPWLSLNFPAAQTRGLSVSHALSHGHWGSEGLCLLSPSCSQLKKRPQERVTLQVSVWEEAEGGVARKSHFDRPTRNRYVPQLVISPLPFSCIQCDPPQLHSGCLPLLKVLLQDFSPIYHQLWEPLGRQDQVKCSRARLSRLYKTFGVLLDAEQKESRVTHNFNRVCSPQSLCTALHSWRWIH